MGVLKKDTFSPCGVTLPETDTTSSDIFQGTDTELVIYNLTGGVYIYDSANNRVETRISAEDLPLSGQDVGGDGFLSDGRLCLLGQSEEGIIFYYIPVGR